MSAEIHELRSSRGADATASPPPLSMEAEQVVLGTMLMRNDLCPALTGIVSDGDFSEDLHRRIYRVAVDLVADGLAASPMTVLPFIGDQDLGDGVSVKTYLARLCRESLPASAALGHARLVQQLAARRAIIEAATATARDARDASPSLDVATIAVEGISKLHTILAASGTDTSRPIGDYADEVIALADGVRSGAVRSEPVTTGYADLDNATGGYQPGTLWVTAGRPGMGKTIFANSSGTRASRQGAGVLEFPLEVGPEQMVARHIADIAYKSGGTLAFRDIGYRSSELSDAAMEAARDAKDALAQLPIEIDRRSRVSVAQIAAKVAQTKRVMAARGVALGLVLIDHLDFIRASDRYAGNRTQEIGEICIGLKDIARTEKVCINLFCQLSREVEKRSLKDRRPGLSDLRNSGDIEQVADVAMFLYRPEYYLTRTAEYSSGDPDALNDAIAARGKLEAILGKVRAGPTPTIHLWCDVAASSISSYQRGNA